MAQTATIYNLSIDLVRELRQEKASGRFLRRLTVIEVKQ